MLESRYVLPCCQVPNPYIAVTTTTDKYVFPWDHSPHTHDMSLQNSESIALGVEDMNLGVV